MKRLPLSQNEEKIWGYILGYITDHNYSPTYKEIALFMGYDNSGEQTIRTYLGRMEEKGYIKFGKGWRNIKIVTQKYDKNKQTK